MNITAQKSKVKKFRQGDSGWMLRDGVQLVPRAYIEIDSTIPPEWEYIVRKAMHQGYIKVVSCTYGRDETFQQLMESE